MHAIIHTLLILSLSSLTVAFTIGNEKAALLSSSHYQHSCQQQQQRLPPPCQPAASTTRHRFRSHQQSSTALSVLLDVPDGFFTVTFPMLGILLSLSKNFVRVRMEERAWEQRLEESRRERLASDPTLTELDLRRREASLEWSAYGKPRMDEEQAEKERDTTSSSRSKRQRVKVMDRDEEDDDHQHVDPREYRMTDDEISVFEVEYGVDYDPYYDDPYGEDELPEEKYQLDRLYGDRVYENGEIFYKDKQTGLYYRQGAKPRNISFWR